MAVVVAAVALLVAGVAAVPGVAGAWAAAVALAPTTSRWTMAGVMGVQARRRVVAGVG